MPVSNAYRTVNIKPVTAPLDMRSQPDEVLFGGFRRRVNWEISDSGKPSRARGFAKLFDSVTTYNNQDLHDQLLSLQTYYDDLATVDPRAAALRTYPPPAYICSTTQRTRTTGRQPITMLSELVSATGQRRLMAGTQNRLYVLEEAIGNWRIISDGYGGVPQKGLPERRWRRPAQVGNIAVLTNNYDPPVYYLFDGVASGCAMQAVSQLPDLALIGLTRAGCCYAWREIVFFGDVTQDGTEFQQRVIWSDQSAPLSWDPAAEGTVQGNFDLNYGEKVMGFVELHNSLLVVTTKSIWQITVSGDLSSPDALAFSFQVLYSEMSTGEACIAYPNTLCTDGTSIFYLGRDDFYEFNLYMSVPRKTKWIHDTTSLIFVGTESISPINRDICESHIAWYDPRTQSIGVSWVAQGDTAPKRILRFHTLFNYAAELDFGVTAACSFTSNRVQTLRQFVLGLCACSAAAFDALVGIPVKTGGLCTAEKAATCTALDATAPFYTNSGLLLSNGVNAENYQATTSDTGSLCRAFGTLSINDICQICKNYQIFVFAHATDNCLKEFGPEVYFREIATAFDTPCGTWTENGYEDKLIMGPMDFGSPDEEKNIRKLELEFDAHVQATPAQINLSIGYSANAFDPNDVATATCGVVWKALTAKDLTCPTPNRTLQWTFWYTGRILYVQLSSSGTGGAYNLSRIGMEVRALPRSTTS